MSRALRITYWPHPSQPLTMGVLEGDLVTSAEQLVEGMLTVSGAGFFTYDIFDVPDNDMAKAIADSILRSDRAEEDERNMAIAYMYYVKCLMILRPDGAMISTEPPPLTREQMTWVLRCLAHHPEYKGQRVEIPMNDGKSIEMKNGEVLPA